MAIYELGKLCKIKRGKVIDQMFIAQNEGIYPVISSNTKNKGILGFINSFDYDGEYITASAEGYAGKFFYQNGKFSITNICFLIEIIQKNICYTKYLYIFLQSKEKEYFNNFSNQSTRPALREYNLVKYPIFLPSLEVQKNIIDIIELFEKLIFDLKKSIDIKINIKNSLLGKIFPKYSNKFPEIYFKKFNENWEIFILEKLLLKSGSGGTPKTSILEYYVGTIPFLTIADISESNGYIFETKKFINEKAIKNSSAWVVPSESISLAMYASVGKVAILKNNVATSQAFFNMVLKNLKTKNFLFQMFKKMEIFKDWNSLISVGTQANLNSEKLKKLKIKIPKKIEEQEKIGNLFFMMDQLINFYQNKFEKLSNIKKQLFKKILN